MELDFILFNNIFNEERRDNLYNIIIFFNEKWYENLFNIIIYLIKSDMKFYIIY